MFQLTGSTLALALAGLSGLAFSSLASATDLTLQGSFTVDDQVQLFDMTVATPGSVDIRSYGYAGGTTSTGRLVPAGGLDTTLTLFSSAGAFLSENDDGTGVATDPLTGQAFDARITASLLPGNYIVALTQYDNFASGATLNDGFEEAGRGNFTADPSFTDAGPCPSGQFRDASSTAGQCRSGNWAVNFVNVASVTPRTPVPEPQSALLLIFGLLGLGALVRKCSSLD